MSDSDVASFDLLRAVIYPDSDDTTSPLGNGADGIYDRVEFTYNRLGEMTQKKDQLQNIHVFEYDQLGRLAHDRVTATGAGVDTAFLRVSRTYEVRGLLTNITSYNNATVGLGSVLNDVQFSYNDFGQLGTEYQSHSGAVNTATSPRVSYAYADGTANHVRLLSITYPNGRVITSDYGTAGGSDDLLSRVTSIKDGTTILAGYLYLGLDRRVQVNYSSEPGVQLTYIKQGAESVGDAGDQYTGLDRFGRVVDQRWLKTADGTHRERVQYGFDRASNRLWRHNLMTTGNDEFYTYDGLYELTMMQRGDLNPTFTGINVPAAFEEDFFFDPTGNWNGTTSWNGSTTGYRTKTNGTTDLDQNRSHNMANEITGITTAVGSAWPAPSQDMNGNITSMPQPNALTSTYSATYDAWNRLVKLMSGISTVGTYNYDGLNRRAQKAAGGITRDFFYSAKWQIVEERSSSPNPGCTDRSFVWGLRYDDDLIARDREPTSSSSASCPGMTERFYALHDQFHVTAAMNTAATVVERYGYDSFGFTRVMTGAFAPRTATFYEWETRYGAYRWDKESQLYQVRNRYQHPKLGRWLFRDPIGYADGSSLYVYVGTRPVNAVDPDGRQLLLPPPENLLLTQASPTSVPPFQFQGFPSLMMSAVNAPPPCAPYPECLYTPPARQITQSFAPDDSCFAKCLKDRICDVNVAASILAAYSVAALGNIKGRLGQPIARRIGMRGVRIAVRDLPLTGPQRIRAMVQGGRNAVSVSQAAAVLAAGGIGYAYGTIRYCLQECLPADVDYYWELGGF